MRSDTLKRHQQGNRCHKIIDRVSACPYSGCNIYTDRTNLRRHLNKHHPQSKDIHIKQLRSLSKDKSTNIGSFEQNEIISRQQKNVLLKYKPTNILKVSNENEEIAYQQGKKFLSSNLIERKEKILREYDQEFKTLKRKGLKRKQFQEMYLRIQTPQIRQLLVKRGKKVGKK